jgi:hypothetical protein
MAQIPNIFKVDNIDFGSQTNNYKSDSKGLRRNTRKNNGQRWNFTVDFFLDREDALEGFAFLNSLDTNVEVCQIDLALITKGVSTAGLVNVLSDAVAGASVIFVVSNSLIKVGQFFKFGNHSKVYQVKEKFGSTEIVIYPQLMVSVDNAGDFLNFTNCPIEAYIDSEIPKMRFTAATSNVLFSLDFVEAI